MADIWQHIEDNDIFGYGIAKDNHAVGAIVCFYGDDVVNILSLGELMPEQQQWLLENVSVDWSEMVQLSLTRSCANLLDGQIVGAVLIAEQPGDLEIVQLYSAAEGEASSMLCLFATMGEAFATLPPDTVVRFHAVDDISDNLVAKLLDNCKIEIDPERIAYRSVSVIDDENEQE